MTILTAADIANGRLEAFDPAAHDFIWSDDLTSCDVVPIVPYVAWDTYKMDSSPYIRPRGDDGGYCYWREYLRDHSPVPSLAAGVPF